MNNHDCDSTCLNNPMCQCGCDDYQPGVACRTCGRSLRPAQTEGAVPAAGVIRAPWTSEQVAALEAFQLRSGMHPFTCGNDKHSMAPRLVPSHSGWYCPDPACDYRQDWAHAFMVNPDAWPKPFPAVSTPDTTPLAALRARLEAERDRAASTTIAARRRKVRWINNGACNAYDDAIDLLDQATREHHTVDHHCPTSCDDDCDTPCHESHAVPHKRDHDPSRCPAPDTGLREQYAALRPGASMTTTPDRSFADDHRFLVRVLEIFSMSHADAYGDLFWRVDDRQPRLFANVSDVFAWGGTDAEPITPDTLLALEQAYADLKTVEAEEFTAELYAARQRGQRPQGAAYPSGAHESWRHVSALYDACGPEREVGLGNPKAAPAHPAAVSVAASPTDQADDTVRCPLCVDARELLTPAEARDHFTSMHPEQPLAGTGPWPMLGTPPADRDAELEQLRAERAALKRAHVALAEQAGKDQTAVARVCALAEEHPVHIDTALIHAALDQLAGEGGR